MTIAWHLFTPRGALIGGFCPGPALVAMGSGLGAAWIFVLAMVVGMVVHDRLLSPR